MGGLRVGGRGLKFSGRGREGPKFQEGFRERGKDLKSFGSYDWGEGPRFWGWAVALEPEGLKTQNPKGASKGLKK